MPDLIQARHRRLLAEVASADLPGEFDQTGERLQQTPQLEVLHRQSHQQELEVERKVEVGLGLFFWVLIGGLIAAIVAGYR